MEVSGMEKVKIKMLKKRPGVDDGEIQAKDFLEGETYDVGPDLAASFIGSEVAEEVPSTGSGQAGGEEGVKAKGEHENKSVAPPENKGEKKDGLLKKAARAVTGAVKGK
jgi:hypothetical protein